MDSNIPFSKMYLNVLGFDGQWIFELFNNVNINKQYFE